MHRRRRAGAVLAAGTTVMLLAGGGGTALAARAAPAGGIISTVAGGVGGPGPGTGISLSDANGAAGPLTLGGPAATAPLGACGVAFDRAGNLVIADHLRHRIDVVPARTGIFYGRAMTAGHLYPVAGDGAHGAG